MNCRKTRKVFTNFEKALLEMEYKKCQYPDYKEKERISEEYGLDEIKVNNWFNNRRKREKHDIPKTEQGSSTSFQCDESNHFYKQPSTSLSETQCKIRDEHKYAKYFKKKQ